MAVSKKQRGPVSSKSRISKPTTHASGIGKSLSKKNVSSAHRKPAAYVPESSAPFQATVLEKVVDISCETATVRLTSPDTLEIAENKFELTILTKEELENSRIKAYSYIL